MNKINQRLQEQNKLKSGIIRATQYELAGGLNDNNINQKIIDRRVKAIRAGK